MILFNLSWAQIDLSSVFFHSYITTTTLSLYSVWESRNW